MSRITSLLNHSASKYFVVGLLAFFTDYLVLLFGYYAVNLPLEIATTLGFMAGFAISFTSNRQWVFGGQQRKKIKRQVTEYSILVGFNYIFTVVAVSALNGLEIDPEIGKLLVMAVIMCWNYALFRWVIFAEAGGRK